MFLVLDWQYSGYTYQYHGLLIPCFNARPRHQQPWNWLFIRGALSTRTDFVILVNLQSITKCNYILRFSQKCQQFMGYKDSGITCRCFRCLGWSRFMSRWKLHVENNGFQWYKFIFCTTITLYFAVWIGVVICQDLLDGGVFLTLLLIRWKCAADSQAETMLKKIHRSNSDFIIV